jgi:RNA polymerase-binding transcription factor DksA
MIETKKQILEAQLSTIITELETIGVQDTKTGDWEVRVHGDELHVADENLEADAIESWHEERAVLAALETTYRNIKRALEKIDTGTYGSCEICHENISSDRLDFLPTARTCAIHMDDEETLEL